MMRRPLFPVLFLFSLQPTLAQVNPCDSLNAEFQAYTSGLGVNFNSVAYDPQWILNWTFGDGTSTTGPAPYHQYQQAGSYQVCLVAWSWDPITQDTCWDDHCQFITVQGGMQGCDSTFSTTFVYTYQAANVVIFQGTSTIPADGYVWDFGDGFVDHSAFTQHHYNQPGQYTACLSAWYWEPGTQDTCWADHCQVITIIGQTDPCDSIPLQADFIYTQSGNLFQFQSTSNTSGYPANYWWDLGDGDASPSPNPIHDYQQPGQYTVCLYVEIGPNNGQDSCFASYCEVVHVAGTGGCDSTFFVTYTWSDDGNSNIIFQSTSGGQADGYLWDFGDGNTGYGQSTQHTYQQQGSYYACVNAWYWEPGTQDTCWTSACQWVWMQGPFNPCDSLTAGFSAHPSGLGVNFANDVIDPSWSYYWDFGDGTSGTGPNPYHTYQQSGTYDVCLVAWTVDPLTQDTCYEDHCELVTVQSQNSACDSTFQAYFTAVPLSGLTISFTGSTNQPADGYMFDLGNGSQVYSHVVQQTYNQPGQYYVCFSAWYWNTQTQDTCWASQCQWITVGGPIDICDSIPLQAGFTHTQNGNFITFQNTSITSGYNANYLWDLGNGQTTILPNPTYGYPQPGVYTVCLYVEIGPNNGLDSCFASYCEVIQVGLNNGCDSSFQAYFVPSQTGPNSFFFNGTNTGPSADGFIWDFGDGNVGYGPSAQHTYQQPGQYYVCLEAWYWNAQTQDTCWTNYCQWVFVQGPYDPCDSLSAYFQAFPGGLGVNFQNYNYDPQWVLQWDFGDGTTGGGPNPYHTYQTSGTYQVCLLAWAWDPIAQDTCWDDHCEWVTVQGGSGCDSTFQAYFVATQLGNNTMFFNGTNTGPAADGFVWDFGDGNVGYGPSAQHTYQQPGQYYVCFDAWYWNAQTQDTCWTSYCEWVLVQGVAGCDSTFFVTFGWSPQGSNAILFQATSGGQADGYNWTFGDGNTSYGQFTQHYYQQPGQYYVCVEAWYWNAATQDTCWTSECQWVTVGGSDPCDSTYASFSYTVSGNTVVFQNTSSASVPTPGFAWDFGDGGSSANVDPTHTYNQPGQYLVCLTVYDANNCVDTLCQVVQVGGPPVPCDSNYTVPFSWMPQGGQVLFVASQASPMPDGYIWHFGDGTIAYQGPTVQHTYPFSSTYQVCLDAWYIIPNTFDTCWTTSCQYVNTVINDPCDSLLSVYFTPVIIQGLTYSFNNGTISINPGNTSFLWDFGEGTTSTDLIPVHTYQMDGTYVVCLTATVQNCTITLCDTVVVSTTSVHELLSENTGPAVYPNPTHDVLYVEMVGIRSLSLVDARGRVVAAQQRADQYAPLHRLRVEGVARGVYSLRAEGKDQTWWSRVVVE